MTQKNLAFISLVVVIQLDPILQMNIFYLKNLISVNNSPFWDMPCERITAVSL